MQYRVSGFLAMGVLATLALGLYLVKYWVQDVQADVTKVQAQLKTERESLHLLGAEWAYLNRPERLEKLSQKYLELAPLSSAQFVSFTHLPEAEIVPVEAEMAPGSAFFPPVGAR